LLPEDYPVLKERRLVISGPMLEMASTRMVLDHQDGYTVPVSESVYRPANDLSL